MTDNVTMRLVVRGDRSEVTALVTMASEQGLMVSAEVERQRRRPRRAPSATTPAQRTHHKDAEPSVYGPPRSFPAGTLVKVTARRSEYPEAAPRGRQARVVQSNKYGPGWRIVVEWLSVPGSRSTIPSSMLAPVKP